MTDFITGKLYMVTTWAMEENRRNLFDHQDELQEGLRVWIVSEGRYVHIKPCEVFMYLGNFVNVETGMGEFLYNEMVFAAKLHSLGRWLCEATPKNMVHYKYMLKTLLEPPEIEIEEASFAKI